jgi:hypothetical protein
MSRPSVKWLQVQVPLIAFFFCAFSNFASITGHLSDHWRVSTAYAAQASGPDLEVTNISNPPSSGAPEVVLRLLTPQKTQAMSLPLHRQPFITFRWTIR